MAPYWWMDAPGALALACTIVLGTFLSEDAATLWAAGLAFSGVTDPVLSLSSAVLGIWLGDLGLYAIARAAGASLWQRPWLRRWITPEARARAEARFRTSGAWAIIASRFVPGTRLPVYLAAGALRMRFLSFAALTAACAIVWVTVIFWLVMTFGETLLAPMIGTRTRLAVAVLLAIVVLALLYALRRAFSRLGRVLRKYRRWEFWPMWLFYPPVVAMCGWLALKHRGLSLPTVANPGLHTGGIIGESKSQYLQLLWQTSPEFTAEAHLLPAGPPQERWAHLRRLCAGRDIQPPFVLKPDVAQRGDGFKLIRSFQAAEEYLRAVPAPVVLQRYAPGPCEAGIFYYRFPQEQRGHIFAITAKEFPSVAGDGIRTFEQLLEADPRASLIAETYLARLPHLRGKVLPAGETVRLVEAGNHCQGCIFHDGSHLASGALLERIDAISRRLPGFFIGRFDIRYRSDRELREGRAFLIVELNGAASEATSIYDPRNSLKKAYRTLYRQWELVFAIGRANRDRGCVPSSAGEVWREWLAYRRQATAYPMAD